MEEMSKKTKLLEKENQRLTKKHDALKSNIIKMAEERDQHLKEIDLYRNADTKMRNIIKSMQEQGRGPPPVQEMVDDGTDSEYDDYDDEDEEDESYIEGDPDEDVLEQDIQLPLPSEMPNGVGKTYGPEPPPKLPDRPPAHINGDIVRPPSTLNGLRH